MTRTLLLIILVSIFSSCKFLDYFSVFNGEKVAEVDGAVLYKSDIDKIVPKGISAEDSLNFVKQYIDSWAIKQLLLLKAEEVLPKGEKDVEKQLEDYRMQLLIFRYENKFVEEKLDTLIPINELKQYYNDHPDNFKSRNGLIKGRLVKIHNSSPNLQIIRKLSGSKSVENMEELEELAFNSAYKYSTYDNSWVDLQTVAREMGEELSKLQDAIAKKDVIEFKDSVYTSILQIVEYIKPNDISPMEYNMERVKEVILTKRKHELLLNLQKDILNNALDNKKLKIINNEKSTD